MASPSRSDSWTNAEITSRFLSRFSDEKESDSGQEQHILRAIAAIPTLDPEVALPDRHLLDSFRPPKPSALFTGRAEELEFLESLFRQKTEGRTCRAGDSWMRKNPACSQIRSSGIT